MNPTPNLAKILAASALALALAAPFATAQTSPAAQPDPCQTQSGPVTTKVFYLVNLGDDQYHSRAQEMERALLNTLCRSDKISLLAQQSAIVVQAPPDQIVLAEKLITEFDRPQKTYRLTYTITELDGDKTIGTQHYAMVVVAGQRTTMKEGTKIPVATGSTGKGSDIETQFTYLDVGMNFDATVNEASDGVQLQSKVEQSSLGQPSTINGVTEPVVRQTVLQGTSFLAPGKPVMLGSIDVPGSTRHFDIAVVLDQVK